MKGIPPSHQAIWSLWRKTRPAAITVTWKLHAPCHRRI